MTPITMHLLFYQFVDGFIEKRQIWRSEHLALVDEFCRQRDIIAAGAYGAPPKDGLLIFDTDINMIEQFMARDPYYQHQLVTNHQILPWVVVGKRPGV